MDSYALELQNVSYSVDNTSIIKDISFQVKKGEFLSIIGPNGAGKTTLLRCIMKFISPDSGNIMLLNRNYRRFNRKQLAKTIAYIPQKISISFPFTVEDFVLMGRYPYNSLFSSADANQQEILQSALRTAKIEHLRDHLLPTLSGGEMQKVLIAGSLAQTPQLFLLDEITTHLDPKFQHDLTDILYNLNRREGMTIVSVTHDINFAMLLSTKILALAQGKIVFWGDAQDLDTSVLSDIYHVKFHTLTNPHTDKNIIFPAWSDNEQQNK